MQLLGIRLECLQHSGSSVLVSRGRAKGMTRSGGLGGRAGAVRSGSAEGLAVSLQPSLKRPVMYPGFHGILSQGCDTLILVHSSDLR